MRRRYKDFEVELNLLRPSFVSAPRDEQRQWLVNRAIDELAEQLRHLDFIAPRFVGGATRKQIEAEWQSSEALYNSHELLIEGQQVMQDWERPLMQKMAAVIAGTKGDVLEIGFGLGLSATFIQEHGVRSHTIVELNADVLDVASRWAKQYPGADIELVHGRWQDVLPNLGHFDGILWDAFPISEQEYEQYVMRDSTAAEAFFPEASLHLRPGGVFSYYTNEIDSLSRRHQRSLLRHFSSFRLETVTELNPPANCEYWWADRMAVVTATV